MVAAGMLRLGGSGPFQQDALIRLVDGAAFKIEGDNG
jgi:hypothetical protein